jgi:hypothetical protein
MLDTQLPGPLRCWQLSPVTAACGLAPLQGKGKEVQAESAGKTACVCECVWVRARMHMCLGGLLAFHAPYLGLLNSHI